MSQQFNDQIKSLRENLALGRFQSWSPSDNEIILLINMIEQDKIDQDLFLLLEHIDRPRKELFESIIRLISKTTKDEWKPFALSVGMKHLIPIMERDGIKIPESLKHKLSEFLNSKHLETLEWTLRFIDQCGALGIVFKDQILALKPPLWKFWNQSQQNVLEMLRFLEVKWKN